MKHKTGVGDILSLIGLLISIGGSILGLLSILALLWVLGVI